MKRLKLVLAVLLIIAFLFCSLISVFAVNEYRIALFADNAGVFACESDETTVTVRDVVNSKGYKYSFESKVLSYCVTGGVLYAATSTGQSSVVIVAEAKNGLIIKKIPIKTQHVGNTTKICVDGDGRIYLFNHKKQAEVYDAKGKYIGTTSNMFFSMTVVKGSVYASNTSGIYRLNGSSESFVCGCGNDLVYGISSEYIATLSGSVHNVNTGKKVLSLDMNRLYSVALSAKYFIALKGNNIDVYDRNSAEHISSYKLSFSPYGICAAGGKVYVIKDTAVGISVVKYKESNFLASDSTNSDGSLSNPTGISFGKYKTSGKCVFLPSLTTRVEFRSEVKYDGYTLKFNKSSGLGTNTKATFTKDNKSYVYTIIVKGDITGAGRINEEDVNVLSNCLLGLDKVGGIYKTAADMNGDGKLSNVDLVMQDRRLN